MCSVCGAVEIPPTHKMIYALRDPRTNMVRYVGASRDPEQRWEEHCASAFTHRTPLADWLWGLITYHHCLPILETWEEWRSDWDDEERRVIAHYLEADDGDLLNRYKTGRGLGDDHKKRLKAAQKKFWAEPSEARELAKARISAAKKGKPHTEQHRKRISEALRRRYGKVDTDD